MDARVRELLDDEIRHQEFRASESEFDERLKHTYAAGLLKELRSSILALLDSEPEPELGVQIKVPLGADPFARSPEPDARYVVERYGNIAMGSFIFDSYAEAQGAVDDYLGMGCDPSDFRILPVGPVPRVEPVAHRVTFSDGSTGLFDTFQEAWDANMNDDGDTMIEPLCPEPVGRAPSASITIHGDMDTVELLDLIAKGYVEEAAQKAKAMAGRAPESEEGGDEDCG